MEITTRKQLSELLPQLMEAKNINLEKLTELTGVPKRFLSALTEGNLEKLPARPYVRGYLLKIAEALEVGPDILLQAYKESDNIPSSGKGDVLPVNRFAFQPLTWRNTVLTMVGILFLLYAGFRANDILGLPTITITSPNSDLVKTKTIKIEGVINPGDELKLNNEVVYTEPSGHFEKEISLDPGLNTLEFTVKRFLGRENRMIKQIFYEPSE